MNRVNSRQYLILFFFVFGMTLCSYVIPSEAQTVARGRITTNTTWTASNSPYEVPVAVIIGKDVTLTIEPGVIVKMDAGAIITVEGELIARGTQTSKITFTGGGGTPGGWGTIRFMEGAKSATFTPEGEYASGSILENCIIEFGGGIDNAAVLARTTAPYFKDCLFRNNKRPIYYDNVSGTTNTPRLKTCGFIANKGGVNSEGSTISFMDCVFIRNSAEEGAAVIANWSTISFVDCIFFSNSTTVSGGNIVVNGGKVSFRNCNLRNTTRDIYASRGAILSLENCFIRNSSGASGGAVFVEDNSDMYLTNCIFSENSVESVIAFLGRSGFANGCTFYRNQATRGVVYTTVPISFTENVFWPDNKAPYLLIFDQVGTNKLDARNTYWGTDDLNKILFELILHNFTDARLGEVLIEPIRTSKDTALLSITFPTRGAILEQGKSYRLTWQWIIPLIIPTGEKGALAIYLLKISGEVVKRIVVIDNSAAIEFAWVVDVDPGTYTLAILAVNQQGRRYQFRSEIFSVAGSAVNLPPSDLAAPKGITQPLLPTQLTVTGNLIKPENVSSVEITGKARANVQVNVSLKDGVNAIQKNTTSDASGLFKVVIDASGLKDGNIIAIASEAGGQELSITVIKDTKPSEKPEFLISALNQTQSAEVGKNAIYIINLLSRGGFKSDLTLRIADAPKGIETEFNPKVVSISSENPLNSSQLTIRVGNDTPVGE